MKLSAVVGARNDDYGGNLATRATFCLLSLIDTFDEVWYIDWGSETHSLLYEIIDDLPKTGKLRHVVIPPDAVGAMTHYDINAQRFCEVLARNIGIRRATGDWLLSTNIDVICPSRDNLDEALSMMNKNTFYTISRRPVDVDIVKKYAYADWKSLRVELSKTIPPRTMAEAVVKGDEYSLINCCGDFQFAHRDIWQEIRGFEESLIYSLYTDSNVQKKAIVYGFKLEAKFEPPLFHINHGKGAGGFGDGINKITNNPMKALIEKSKTENSDTWGFSDVEIEYEVI